MAKKKEEVYRALTGLNFAGEDGEEKRYEPGDKIEGMDENALKGLISEGYVEKWKSGQTDNVREDGTGFTVEGVVTRHNDGELVVKGVGE